MFGSLMNKSYRNLPWILVFSLSFVSLPFPLPLSSFLFYPFLSCCCVNWGKERREKRKERQRGSIYTHHLPSTEGISVLAHWLYVITTFLVFFMCWELLQTLHKTPLRFLYYKITVTFQKCNFYLHLFIHFTSLVYRNKFKN